MAFGLWGATKVTGRQLLDVSFPYCRMKGAQNDRQMAEVVSVIEQPQGKISVGLHSCAAKYRSKLASAS